jgi:hypothetical protein
MLKNRVLSRIFGPKRERERETKEEDGEIQESKFVI